MQITFNISPLAATIAALAVIIILAMVLKRPGLRSLHDIHRSQRQEVLGGVCGGLAETTDTPTWLWRLGFVMVAICFGTGVLAYILLWIFVPKR